MIDFASSFLAWLASTIVPAFLGLIVIVWIGTRVNPKYLAAFALGIFLWFFLDTIGGSANLDVNDGFTGGAVQVAVVVLFLIGAMFFFYADRKRQIFDGHSDPGKYGIIIPLLVAGAVAMHGLGRALPSELPPPRLQAHLFSTPSAE